MDNNQEEKKLIFDPITDKPNETSSNQEAPNLRFDPMTGKPIAIVNNQEEPKLRFDPMTGKPIEIFSNQEEPKVRFDPMTGKPIETSRNQEEPKLRFDPMTGKPITILDNKKNGRTLLATMAAVVVLLIIVFAAVKSSVFLGKGEKVLLAAENTFKEKFHLLQDLEMLNILKSDNYTISIDADVEGASINAQYSTTSSEKQISAKIDMSEYSDFDAVASATSAKRKYPDFEFKANLNSSQLKAKTSLIDNYLFTYNYKKEKDGYIEELFSKDDIESFDQILESVFSTKKQEDLEKKILKVIYDEYRSLKFEDASKKEFKIDEKKCICKGYTTTITSDNIEAILDGIEDILDESYEDAFEVADLEIDELFDELRESIQYEMSDIDVTFYLYRNELACINLEAEGEVQILFRGGDMRMQNIEILVDDESVLEVKGSDNGSSEKIKLLSDDEDLAELEYNYKTGDFKIKIYDYYDTTRVEGNIQSAKNELKITLDEFGYIGDSTILIKKGASIEKMSGEELDIGNASYSDFEDLFYEIEGDALDLINEYLLENF